MEGTTSFFASSTSVSGPGQKRAARINAAGGICSAYFSISAGPATMSESGFTSGRPLTL